MTWSEFCSLLSGLGEDTPLVRTVMIRLEEDENMLKGFNTAQRRIRSEWRSRTAQSRTPQETDDFLGELQSAFAQM